MQGVESVQATKSHLRAGAFCCPVDRLIHLMPADPAGSDVAGLLVFVQMGASPALRCTEGVEKVFRGSSPKMK